MKKELIYALIGIALGAFLMHWLFFPEVKTKTLIETVTETDTVYITLTDTIYQNSIKHRIIRDTVLIEPIRPEIKAFSATFPLLYGNAHLSGEVLGEVLKTSLETDFKIPTITNMITETKTVTNTIAPKGLYIGASINTELIPSVGASYLDKDWLLNYDYTIKTKVHSVGVRKKLF